MPIVRYQIRNEYGLADPDLYGAADKDDPEALLEGVSMAGLVGVLRQLGDLAEFAAQIFHDLHEEVLATSARGHSLMLRVHQLEEEFPAIEKVFLSQTSHSRIIKNIGINWHPNVQIEQNLVTRGDMPRHILDSYEECRGPPQLFTLDKFDIAGAGACLKRYTDPSFFKMDLASSGIMESEIQREKRPRKTKKKGLRSRNGDTLESLMKPDAESSYSVTASEKVPANLSVKRVTLKARPVNSLNSLTGRSYMECILNRLPVSHNDGCGNSWNQARHTKSVDSVTEVHEIVMDTSSKDLLFRKGAEAQPTTGQELQARNPNKQEERRLDAFTKSSLGLQSDEIKRISSITGNGSHTFLHDADRKVNQNTVNDGSGLEKVIFPESEQKESIDAWSRTDGSGDHYASDDIASELDNYMDALNTMDSELEADTESRAKPEPDLLVMKPQRTDSYINHEQQDRKVQSPNLRSFKNSSEALDNKKEDNLIGEEKSTMAIEADSVCNNASNCSSVPLLSEICENQHITERLKETEQAVELYSRENMDDKKVCNIKETEMSASIWEYREAHCGSQNKETISSPPHFGQQSYTEVQLDNPSSDFTYVGKLVRSNSGSGSAVATNEEKSMISETISLPTKHAESNAITESDLSLANDDLEFASSAEESVSITILENSDVPSTSPLQSHRIEGDHVHENKVSQMNTISGTSEDVQINSVPALLSEDVISGNVSTDNVQKSPLLSVEEEPSMLTKQDQKKDDGEENFAVESEEFECLEQETSSGISGDAPKCDIEIPSNQTSKLEDHSDPWTLVLHDTEAKLERSCSDVEPSIGLSIARDDLHSSMVLETSADVFKEENVPVLANALIEENTLSACLVADSTLDDHGNEGYPVITSPQRNSDFHVKMPDECGLHDSDQNQHELISRETYCQEDVFKLDSLKAPAPLHAKVEDDAVVPPCDLKDDISDPSNCSSSVTSAPQEEELGNAVASDDHPDSIETGMSPVDSAQPSDMKELASTSEEHAAVSVIEQLDLDKSSTTSECVKELHPQRHPDNGSSCREETEAMSLSLESGVDGSLQQEVNPTVSKADDIIERDIPQLSDPFALGLRHHADCPEHVLADARLNENQETPYNSQCSRANALHASASAAAVETLTTDSFESARCGAPTETLCFHDLETSNKDMNLLNEALVPEMQQIAYPMEDKGRTSDHQGSQSKVEASVSLQSRPYVQSSEDTDDLNIAQQTVHVLSYEKAHVSNYSHTSSSSASGCNQSVADKNSMLLESSENISMHDSSFTNKPYSGDSGLLCSSFNCSSKSLESNSNASASLSLDVPIPEPCPVNAHEKVGNDNAFNLPFPGLDTSKDALSDAPPLPPMPPLQWRLGKQGVGPQMPAAASPGPSAGLAPGISRSVPEHPHNYPESIQNTQSMSPFAAMTTFENEKSLNGHLSFGAEKESSSVFPERIAVEQSRRGYGTTTVEGNAAQPSQSLATAYLGGDHYHYGPESSQAEKLHSFNPFISEPISSHESIQQFSPYTQGQKTQSSKSSVSLPVFETRESQVIPPKLAGELIQSSNPSLYTSNTETDNYLYGRIDFGGERIQAMDLPTSSSMALGYMPQHLFFATGGENAYAPYTFFPEMDAQRRNGKPSSILNRPRDPLIEAVASHDRSMLRKVSEMPPTSSKPKVGERNVLLEQIKNKSFSLKSAAVTKPNVSRPPTNLKVAAILEKANAIRQACVGSDEDDEDNWSDC